MYIYIYVHVYRIKHAFVVKYVCVNIDLLETMEYTKYIKVKEDSKQRYGYGPVVHLTW